MAFTPTFQEDHDQREDAQQGQYADADANGRRHLSLCCCRKPTERKPEKAAAAGGGGGCEGPSRAAAATASANCRVEKCVLNAAVS